MKLIITKEYWENNPAIQADYKVGDELELPDGVQQLGGINLVMPQDGERSSEVLDNMQKQFGAIAGAGKLEATTYEKVLPSGAVAVITKFKGSHVKRAQRQMVDAKDTDSADMMSILMAMCTTIDGKPIVSEDTDEMDGHDYLVLLGEFSAANFHQS